MLSIEGLGWCVPCPEAGAALPVFKLACLTDAQKPTVFLDILRRVAAARPMPGNRKGDVRGENVMGLTTQESNFRWTLKI